MTMQTKYTNRTRAQLLEQAVQACRAEQAAIPKDAAYDTMRLIQESMDGLRELVKEFSDKVDELCDQDKEQVKEQEWPYAQVQLFDKKDD